MWLMVNGYFIWLMVNGQWLIHILDVDRCKTDLHHVRKQETLEQMQLVLQKQLGDAVATENSWGTPGTEKHDQSQMSVFAL